MTAAPRAGLWAGYWDDSMVDQKVLRLADLKATPRADQMAGPKAVQTAD